MWREEEVFVLYSKEFRGEQSRTAVKTLLGRPGPRLLPSFPPPAFVRKPLSSCLLPHNSKMAATPDLCLCSRQKEYGKAKGKSSSAAFKKSTLKLFPVLHLHLIGQKGVTWPSLDQSLEGDWRERGMEGLGSACQCVCYRWVFVPEHTALRPQTQEPANPEMASFQQSFNQC